MPELLIEIFSEDIPARMQVQAAENFKNLIVNALEDKGLKFDKAFAQSTPRRIVTVVTGLPDKQPDVSDERRGPRVDAPEKAIEGFMRGNGIESLDECEQRETDKGAFWFVVKDIKGRATADVLGEIVPMAIKNLPWPKSMRWGTTSFRWVRPLHNVLVVFDGKRVDGEIDTGMHVYDDATAKSADGRKKSPAKMEFSHITWGHRFIGPEPFEVTDYKQYKKKLYDAGVMVDRAERRNIIVSEAQRIADELELNLVEDEALFEEVTGLVEWPVVLHGQFDEEFLDVPQEALISSMRSHQKYLSLMEPDGDLANRFIVVANMVTQDEGKQVAAGNERVLRARLADAKFFWDQDRKDKLESRIDALDDMMFHARLGTVKDKAERLGWLSRFIADEIGDVDADAAERAAKLAKADLTTGMVGEFPDLQGLMGRYYALNDGEDEDIAEAIAEHYSPLGPNDACPNAPLSITVALADKIDTLAGFFAIDEKPTGSKDPYALRRAALGIIRLIVENRLRVSLSDLFRHALSLYPKEIRESTEAQAAEKAARTDMEEDMSFEDIVSDTLLAFFADRLKVALRDEGVRHDLIDAVFSAEPDDDLTRLLERVTALQSFLETENGSNLLAAYKRAANIVRIEEKKDGTRFEGDVANDLLEQDEETMLFTGLKQAREDIAGALGKEKFEEAMAKMSDLRAPVDAFFDKVTVNAEQPDIRVNRLRLLSHISTTMDQVADFSKIEG